VEIYEEKFKMQKDKQTPSLKIQNEYGHLKNHQKLKDGNQ